MIDRALNTYFDTLDAYDPVERGTAAAARVNAHAEAETAALQHLRGLGVPVPSPEDYDYGAMWQSGFAPKVDARGRVPLPPKHYRLAQQGFDVSGWVDDEDPAISSTLLAWNEQQDGLRLKLSPTISGPRADSVMEGGLTPARVEYEQKALERIQQQLQGPNGLQNLIDAFQKLGIEAGDLFPSDPTPTHIYDIEGAPPSPEPASSPDVAFTGERVDVAAVPKGSLRLWTDSDMGNALRLPPTVSPAALRGLREQAAKIERVNQATLFIDEQGRGVVHVRADGRIPDSYAKFAADNNLELVVRENYGNEMIDGRYMAGAAALGATGAASAGALPMEAYRAPVKSKAEAETLAKKGASLMADVLTKNPNMSWQDLLLNTAAMLAGSPVDTVAFGMDLAGVSPGQAPVGGYKWIQTQMKDSGLVSGKEDTATEVALSIMTGLGLPRQMFKTLAQHAQKMAKPSGKAVATVAGAGAMGASEDVEALPFTSLDKIRFAVANATKKVDISETFKATPKQIRGTQALAPQWDGKTLAFKSEHYKDSRHKDAVSNSLPVMSDEELVELIRLGGTETMVPTASTTREGWITWKGIPKGSSRSVEMVLIPDPAKPHGLVIYSAVYKDTPRKK